MNRRDAVLGLLALGVAPDACFAQQPVKIYRIGFLTIGFETTRASAVFSPLFDALREIRYVEGRNIIVERRFAAGSVDRLDEFAAELVRLKVDLIIAVATPAAQAAQKATTAIPIVFLAVVDPVGAGLVTRLARPDGNITGFSFLSTELSGKRVEILKEVVPKLSRVGILSNPANASNALQLREVEAAARTLGVQPQTLEVRSSNDIEAAFQAAVRGRAGALILLDDPLLAAFSVQTRIGTLTAKHRLPTMSGFKESAEAGGLIAYGASLSEQQRRAATYVDNILKGARPAELPVEQPTKFELVINLKTAKALGITIPQSVLLRADEVIQ